MAGDDETALIERIAAAFASAVAPGALSFSDDAALLPPVPEGATRVVSTDAVVEGVDFDRALYPLEHAGARALLQNLSDLAAMGAAPVGFVWSLAIPPSWSGDDVVAFGQGAARLARSHRCPLYGGDLSTTTGPFVASITVFGDVGGAPLLRGGAQVGDTVWLGAPVGASSRGLALLLQARAHAGGRTSFETFVAALSVDDARAVWAHVGNEAAGARGPQLALGQSLVGRARAALDVSDGLLKDAHRLARASNVHLALDGAGLVDACVPGGSRAAGLEGGEDYVLLFTASPLERFEGCVRAGRVVAGAGVSVDGVEVAACGYGHRFG